MSDNDLCDYCYSRPFSYIRPVGVEIDGENRVPVIRMWCGECDVDDDTDIEALYLLMQIGGSK